MTKSFVKSQYILFRAATKNSSHFWLIVWQLWPIGNMVVNLSDSWCLIQTRSVYMSKYLNKLRPKLSLMLLRLCESIRKCVNGDHVCTFCSNLCHQWMKCKWMGDHDHFEWLERLLKSSQIIWPVLTDAVLYTHSYTYIKNYFNDYACVLFVLKKRQKEIQLFGVCGLRNCLVWLTDSPPPNYTVKLYCFVHLIAWNTSGNGSQITAKMNN